MEPAHDQKPLDLPPLDQGLATLAADTDLILCDVWGVIHNGVAAFAPAVDALCRFREGGGTVILVTNAPVPEARVQSRLDRLGVARAAYDRVVTAGDVTIDLLVAAGCPPIFNIGPNQDAAIYTEAARRGPHAPPHVAIADASMAVCLGPDVGERPEDYDPVLAEMKGRDLEMICANPDIVVEVGDTLVYCAGAIAQRYEAIGGRVVQTGKPFAAIYERAFALAEALRGPTVPSRTLAIGDAIATDVTGAARQGVPCLFITAGIHRARLHRSDADPVVDGPALSRLLDESGIRPEAAATRLRWLP